MAVARREKYTGFEQELRNIKKKTLAFIYYQNQTYIYDTKILFKNI